MNVQKMREALDIGLSAVLATGYTQHQENDADAIREALAEIDRPIDIRIYSIDKNGVADHCTTNYVLLDDVQSFAEIYHDKQCAKCKAHPSPQDAV